ncbi:RagB/SusD family nutrient uptake outer membrane protein [Niabella drilacis]|uniref:Starch-binding associating with outer membrane n=1 Tax=Niabella drilacis (strain DSM 25811 / CCM 8410 / CCUG 62505 / LMG 26954 / E90) TaxID=1285928 RepID=A0A1G7ACI3_NIADE|nr:RagB/SusD family nutrient uptake outer membrane protein [Niabella drilacis]SDE12638.1 Starch-binding associating with outer membrane [Niabella drilacis]
MKKAIYINTLFLLAASLVFTACNKGFLDTQSQNRFPADVTWSDGNLAQAFINGLYAGLYEGGFQEEMLASLTDEAIFTHAGRGINTVNEGNLNPSNPGFMDAHTEWGNMYNIIRMTNLAVEGLATATFDNPALKQKLEGEARLLRAYYYHQLLRFYGGIPLITKSYKLNEDYSAARNTYAEVSDFIIKEADAAYTLLKDKQMQRGDVSALTALALKSRQLLYDASDLHDMPTAKAKSAVLAAYGKPELLGFVSGDRKARWTAARDAAKKVLDEAVAGYKTNLAAPVSFDQAKKNYLSIAMGGGSKHPDADPAITSTNESIFERTFSRDLDEGAQQHGLRQGPNGYNNWAGNTPIEELVDDYVMMDGTKFDWNNPAEKADPYVNREARFYICFLYDGAPWKPRGRTEDPANEIQTGSYTMNGTTIPGLDTRLGPIENWNGSFTGYYFRKFVDPDPNLRDNSGRQYIPWPFFRYTEAMFNYIEACIELGEDGEARTWLNKIRFRAGLPAVTESGDALRQRYRLEKRVEMVFEEQRYFDARRWMIAPQTLGRKTTYIQVRGVLKPGATAPSPYRKDKTKFDYTYTPVETNSLENRIWLDKMYYRPIRLDEIQKNKLLDGSQNPGYE